MAEDWQNGGFGLYIHWPFCEAKCPYCDFNSHVARKIDQSRWKRAYIAELNRAAETCSNRVLNSVFFGGGTPSLMDPDTVAEVMAHVRTLWPTANDLEVTLEANPSSVEADRFQAFSQAGISRVSMGIQALNDHDLKRLGRIHTAVEAKQAFDIARKYFDRVSFDLIYARQDQSVEDWRLELTEALSMAIDHLSLYQLTIEPGTPFALRKASGGLNGLPNDDLAGDMYDVTQDICSKFDMSAYEVSNHAKTGSESRHNLIYWRYGDYLGIGPGAHGRVTYGSQRYATEQFRQPDRWLTEAEAGNASKVRSSLSQRDQAIEFVMMGLRLSEGVDKRRYTALAGKEFSSETLAELTKLGMIFETSDRIHTTEQGRLVLNSVLRELLED